jgi:hypothetical protein
MIEDTPTNVLTDGKHGKSVDVTPAAKMVSGMGPAMRQNWRARRQEEHKRRGHVGQTRQVGRMIIQRHGSRLRQRRVLARTRGNH